MNQQIKIRVFRILEGLDESDYISKSFHIFITALILLNVIAVVLETVQSISQRFSQFFSAFEIFSVIIFTIEYLLRLWSCTTNPAYHKPITGRIRFAMTPLALIDLLAILPFYLPIFVHLDLRIIRILRLFRIFRVFKLARYSESVKILSSVIKRKKEELLIVFFVLFILLIVASSLMYFVENDAQPNVFSSIPMAMWWCIVTLTTVGYGDIYPITVLGRILGGIIALLGIGMFALPTGILASAFAEELQKKHERPKICPHCGKVIDKNN